MSTPVPPVRVPATAMMALAQGSPPPNVIEFIGELIDFLESYGYGFLRTYDHNRLAPAEVTNVDAVHADFTAGVKAEDGASQVGPVLSSSTSAYGYGGAFYDCRHAGSVFEHSSRRVVRMSLFNYARAGFIHHPGLLIGVPKGDFFSMFKVLDLLAAANPQEEFVTALSMLITISAPSQDVDFGELASKMKQIQEVLLREREGNLVVGDQVAVLFLARSLRLDTRFATGLELFLQQDPLPLFNDALIYFQKIASRFEVSTSGLAAVAFSADVGGSRRLCFNQMNRNYCSRGDSCTFSHDPRAIQKELARRESKAKDAKDACGFCQKDHAQGFKCSQKAEFEAFKASQAKAAPAAGPAGHMAQAGAGPVTDYNGHVAQVAAAMDEFHRLRVLLESEPVMADRELQDMLGNARDR